MYTEVNINGSITRWPISETQLQIAHPCTRTYYLRWDKKGFFKGGLYAELGLLESQKQIENLCLFGCQNSFVATFNDRQLHSMATSCYGVGLLEAWLRSNYDRLPPFIFEHPYAQYCILTKGKKYETPLN